MEAWQDQCGNRASGVCYCRVNSYKQTCNLLNNILLWSKSQKKNITIDFSEFGSTIIFTDLKKGDNSRRNQSGKGFKKWG